MAVAAPDLSDGSRIRARRCDRPPHSVRMAVSCHWISMGTLATLTKVSSYEWLDRVQTALVLFAAGRAWQERDEWQDAWASFAGTHAYRNLVSEMDVTEIQIGACS